MVNKRIRLPYPHNPSTFRAYLLPELLEEELELREELLPEDREEDELLEEPLDREGEE